MPFQIIRDDITKVRCDAIVNAAKNSLLGGGGVDGAIHRAAGPELLEECRTLGGCETGMAKITKGYRLPAGYVIHTVGPVYRDGKHGEKELLASCYRQSLLLAEEYHCGSVAFPLISAGVFGYPKAEAIRVAADVITEFLLDHDMTVYLVLFNRAAYLISQKLYSDIKSYIDDVYVDAHTDRDRERRARYARMSMETQDEEVLHESLSENLFVGSVPFSDAARKEATVYEAPAPTVFGSSLDNAVSQIGESFTQMLLRKIDEKGMTDSQCYKKANIDRKLFSKIRSNIYYRPSKPTAIAFAIALELPLEETRELLMKAGFALSHSDKFDIIIEYFIRQQNYNIFEINEALFAFDQNLLGA